MNGSESEHPRPDIVTGPMTVPCPDLDRAMADLQRLGFRLNEIGPADAPAYAVMESDGVQVRLDRSAHDRGERHPFLPLNREPGAEIGPDASTWLRTVPAADDVEFKPSLTVTRLTDDDWHVGRAGMRYRDLIPDRWGGSVIASHINITHGGPVPDYVHHHRIDFQLIFCHRGWVKVVYQDQGDPFVLHPGDAVLQACGIRHRVLEASDDFDVIEISSPALHPTMLDHDLELPNGLNPARRYGDQDYVHHRHDAAPVVTMEGSSNLSGRDLGLFPATNGLLQAHVIEPAARGSAAWSSVEGLGRFDGRNRMPFLLLYMLDGTAEVEPRSAGEPVTLTTDDSIAIPASVSGEVRFGLDFARALVITAAPAGSNRS